MIKLITEPLLNWKSFEIFICPLTWVMPLWGKKKFGDFYLFFSRFQRAIFFFIFQRLQKAIVKIVDINYGGENGFHQAVTLSADVLGNIKFIREKNLLGTI